MPFIIKNGGVFTMWGDSPLEQNTVTTLGPAPETPYGIAEESTEKDKKHYPGIPFYAALHVKMKKNKWFAEVDYYNIVSSKKIQQRFKDLMEDNNDWKDIKNISLTI